MSGNIGNFITNAVSLDVTHTKTIRLNPETHTKPVNIHCETYKDEVYIGKQTFTSLSTPQENSVTFKTDPNYNFLGCSFNGIDTDDFIFANPLPSGISISYTFYEDYAKAKTETEAAQTGGIVVKFKSDQKISSADSIEIQVLTPFARFYSIPQSRSVVVDPPVTDFAASSISIHELTFSGSFEANQEYVVTFPDSKVGLRYKGGNYFFATSAYHNGQSLSYYQDAPKKIEFTNAASFATILASAVLVAFALVALF